MRLMSLMSLMRIPAPILYDGHDPPGLPLAKRPSPVRGLERGVEGSAGLDMSRSSGNGCVAITISASERSPNYSRYIGYIVGRL